MKFSLFALKVHLKTDASQEQICDALRDVGLEVREITDCRERLEDFVVAEILSAERMKRLAERTHHYCQIFDGEKEFGIACGGLNVDEETEGMKVVLARTGVTMPTDNKVIERWKLGRKYSYGNICSAAELGIGEDTENVVELPSDAPVGKSIALMPELCTVIEITPPHSERGSSLDVRGIAKKLAAFGIGELKPLGEELPKITDDALSRFNPEERAAILNAAGTIREADRKVGRVGRDKRALKSAYLLDVIDDAQNPDVLNSMVDVYRGRTGTRDRGQGDGGERNR